MMFHLPKLCLPSLYSDTTLCFTPQTTVSNFLASAWLYSEVRQSDTSPHHLAHEPLGDTLRFAKNEVAGNVSMEAFNVAVACSHSYF